MIDALKALTSRRIQYYLLILLIPGLSFKRWLAVGAFGIAALAIGIIFSLRISTGPVLVSFFETASLRGESHYTRGAVFIGIGIIAAGFALFGLSRSLRKVGQRTRHWNFVDSLYVERILGSGPKVVVIGGGTGMPSLLRGLKHYTSNITAVVTMADDGGSSGRLRAELGIPPPGDIRNCLVALADSEDVMQQLMDYRFSSSGQLDGHSVGNILIAALVDIGGDFSQGVEAAGELLAIRGRVVPSTGAVVTLVGSTAAGETLIGESQVGLASDQLTELALVPPDPPAHPEAVRAIEQADMVVLGPGSLFTSIVPNLLVRDIARAVEQSEAFRVYICNVAEEPNQTEGFTVKDHLNVLRHYGGPKVVDAVVANINLPEGPTPAGLDFIVPDDPWDDDVLLVKADVLDAVMTARHDPDKLSGAIAQAYSRHRGRRRRLPRLRLSPNSGRARRPAAPSAAAEARTESPEPAPTPVDA